MVGNRWISPPFPAQRPPLTNLIPTRTGAWHHGRDGAKMLRRGRLPLVHASVAVRVAWRCRCGRAATGARSAGLVSRPTSSDPCCRPTADDQNERGLLRDVGRPADRLDAPYQVPGSFLSSTSAHSKRGRRQLYSMIILFDKGEVAVGMSDVGTTATGGTTGARSHTNSLP
jgi:hypothetical protein